MRKIIALLSILFLACEDVIEVDVPESEPRLVIEANIFWDKETTGNEQQIKLSVSTPYFSEIKYVPATGALVTVMKLEDNSVFTFTEMEEGSYVTSSFVPELNKAYELRVVYNEEVFTGTEIFTSVSEINEITQSTEGGFDDEMIEINIFFDDPENEENYYLTRFQQSGTLLPYYFPLRDEFTNGNEMTVFYEKQDDPEVDNDELNPGNVVAIELAGISERYYNYFSLLLEQTDKQGPFGTTPAPLIGNCINETNPDRKPFGYFRLSERVKTSYTVQ